MKKQKIELKINDYSLKTTGYLNNEILSFFDKDTNNTEIIIDLNNDILIRNNEDYKIKMNFQKKIIEYKLKKENLEFDQDINIIMLKKSKNEYIINYQIEQISYNMQIIYKEEIS